MPSLSITAPRFLPEDERLEKESLTDEEREEIHNDIYGLDSFEETEEMRNAGLAEFEEAINMIEDEDKEAFLEATQQCPELVDTESNPILFLRREKYDAWAAADRLMKYWDFRVFLFGERAFLPMTCTGHGALSEEDIELLCRCPLVFLPPDQQGRAIFYVDRSKAQPDERMAMMRLLFYMFDVANESDNVQTRGIVLVINTKYYSDEGMDRKFYKFWSYVAQGYHPMDVKVMHICAPAGKSVFLLVMPFVKHMIGRHLRQRYLLHMGTDSELLIDLGDYGIKKLPTTLGGKLVLEAIFEEWFEQRRHEEILREEAMFQQQPNLQLLQEGRQQEEKQPDHQQQQQQEQIPPVMFLEPPEHDNNNNEDDGKYDDGDDNDEAAAEIGEGAEREVPLGASEPIGEQIPESSITQQKENEND